MCAVVSETSNSLYLDSFFKPCVVHAWLVATVCILHVFLEAVKKRKGYCEVGSVEEFFQRIPTKTFSSMGVREGAD